MLRKVLLSAVLFGLMPVGTSHAKGDFNGYMIGDAFVIAGHHIKEFKGLSGFQYRRIYLTYDNDLGGEAFSTRLRFEMAQADQNNANANMAPFVKDAYLQYKNGDHKGHFGITGTPTFGLEEDTWGYRSVEKTPIDLQGWRSSRDQGVKVAGKFGPVGYETMVGNGEGNNHTDNKNQAFYLALNAKPAKGLVVEAYADYYNNRTIDTNKPVGNGNPAAGVPKTSEYLFRFFAAYKGDWGRVGGSVSHLVDEGGGATNAGPDAHMNLMSVFAVAKVVDKLAAYARYDYLDYPKTATPTYFNSQVTKARSHLAVLGVDYEASKDVHILPNIEVMAFGKSVGAEGTNAQVSAAGQGARSIVIPRLTVYWKFK